jgi:TRAP-type mannitol/chloroaromatic compound transport system permease small subunit
VQGLLRFSRAVDALNQRVGKAVIWLVLAAVLVSAGNAVMRKAFSVGSNAFLELQLYLFAGVFLFCAPYALLKNEHVRIDVVTGSLSPRTRVWMEIAGTLFFLLPLVATILYLSWPVFVASFASGEISANAGGLPLWPARLLVPAGFALLLLQALSQLVKCVGFLRGVAGNPLEKEHKPTAEEDLAEEIRRHQVADEVVTEVEESLEMTLDAERRRER